MPHAAYLAIDAFRPDLLSDAPYWRGHLPFAGFIVALAKPRHVLELGVQHGDSLFAFAEAMRRHGPEGGVVTGIDAWEGDQHVGAQSDWVAERVAEKAATFGGSVCLIRARFDDAADAIADGSVDLLHIDGSHDETAVREDVERYLPKLSPRGILLMHDIAAFGPHFDVWKVWCEIAAEYPHRAFAHSAGLGVAAIGPEQPRQVAAFFAAEAPERRAGARLFGCLGRAALLAHSRPGEVARAERIGRLPVPQAIDPDSDLGWALKHARW